MSGQVKFGGSGASSPATSTDFKLPTGSAAAVAAPIVDAHPQVSSGAAPGYAAHTEFRAAIPGYASASTHVRTLPAGQNSGFSSPRGLYDGSTVGASSRGSDPYAMGRRYGIDAASWEQDSADHGYDLHDGFSKWVLGSDHRGGSHRERSQAGSEETGQDTGHSSPNDDWGYESLCAPQQSRVWGDPLVSVAKGTLGMTATDGWEFGDDESR